MALQGEAKHDYYESCKAHSQGRDLHGVKLTKIFINFFFSLVIPKGTV